MSKDRRAEMKERIEELVREFLQVIGEDVSREGLRETPERVARMWVDELIAGYFERPQDYVKKFRVDGKSSNVRGDLVIVKDVPVRSICEHHLLPFFGYAHIAYIPTKEVLGFSKFARIINVFGKRLQIQERLTEEVADYLNTLLKPMGLLLVMETIHTCALVRGVEEPMHMVTVASRGAFKDDESLRSEAMSILLAQSSLSEFRKVREV